MCHSPQLEETVAATWGPYKATVDAKSNNVRIKFQVVFACILFFFEVIHPMICNFEGSFKNIIKTER